MMKTRTERGFTLVELLLALTLTLLMTGAALSALMHSNRAAMGATVLTDVNQNLRIAMNIVIRDLIQAGQDIPKSGFPLPLGTPQPAVRPAPPGAEIDWNEDWVTIPAITPGPDLGAIVDGVPTDMVTIARRDATIDFTGVPISIAADGSFLTVTDPNFELDGANGVKPGDIILFTSPLGHAIQEVTLVDGQRIYFGSEAESRLNQRAATSGSIMDLRDGATFPNNISIMRVVLVTYYIAQESSHAPPYLMRKVNYGEPRAIAAGIDNLQLTWDLVDGVTNPANVVEPGGVNTPHQIRKANLHMGARSLDRWTTGDVMRASLSTQVSLRSLAFVDRYQ